MLLQEPLERTKRFFQKTLRCIKSLFPGGCLEVLPIFSFGEKISSKIQDLQYFCKKLSRKQNGTGNKKDGQIAPTEQKEGDVHCSQNSMCVPDHCKLKALKEEKKAWKYSGMKQDRTSYLSAQKLAQKMKEFEMMDVNDGEHVLDVEEVLHYYSLLTSPVYLDIVDQFFTDMYLEFNLPHPTKSANSSMRKLGCSSVHSSMRKLGCGSSIHSSMRKVGSPSVHGSMRKVSSPSIHSSMRKVSTPSVYSSMRKMDSASVHSSMRSLGPLKI
ncbi:uncharacterized protein LOC127243501 [Andrographis paniculata]|uniref:uncharacterized protein LOC127243501 n=1 Tax=Andrographis paniculata TaxID=175694 RepID=UPI0021E85CE0|nr:uncharacterized protein LOC127243501 [Andrographis paniculata]